MGVMVDRINAQEARRRPSDDQLLERAEQLNRRYLEGRAVPSSVRWVGNQAARWGSCTPGDRTIRLSSRLKGMPSWVVDYVLLHELTHLLEPGHTPRFWELLGAFPRTERARGYLEGVSAATSLGIGSCDARPDESRTLSDSSTASDPEAATVPPTAAPAVRAPGPGERAEPARHEPAAAEPAGAPSVVERAGVDRAAGDHSETG